MMKKNILASVAAVTLTAGVAHGRDLPVPHGAETMMQGGSCGMGPQHGQFGLPLGQVNKAGEYNQYCSSLTDQEICLGFIKGHMRNSGEMVETRSIEKAEFCLETFRKSLLGE